MKIIIFLILGLVALLTLRLLTSSQPHFTPGDRVRITIRLTQQPTIKENRQTVHIQNLYATFPRFPEFHYGDRLLITGTVQQGERYYYLENPEATLVEPAGFFANTKRRLTSLISQALPNTESALVSGIALGTKEQLSPEFKQSLINSGTLHVVVASGMNVTLLAGVIINGLVVFLRRPYALPLAVLCIWLYVLIIGFEPPIARAAIMGSLAFGAQQTGRVNLAWWGLFLSGWVMLMVFPSWLKDIGFWLSFAATGGILAFAKPISAWIDKKVRFIPKFFNFLKNDFSVSLSAQIAVAPILWFAFGQFNPWSPFINSIVLWTVAPIMAIGFAGSLIGLLIEPLGKGIIFLAYPLAFWFVQVVQFF